MNKPTITIGQLTSFSTKDAEAIKRLASKLGPDSKPLNDNDLKDMITSSVTHLFVARDSENQNIVGMVTLIVYRIPYLKKGRLEDLIVNEAYRGQGIGSLLLKKAITYAKQLGASYLDFTSRPTRIESNKLYEKFGFKKRDTNVYRMTYDYEEAQ